jgi:ribonuclease HI
MMPTLEMAYPGLWRGSWGRTPESFGLGPEDAAAEVCELCLWHDCDRCRFNDGPWEDGRPPLGLLLEGRDYYESLPPRDGRRDCDAELDDTVERSGAALVFHRGPSQSIVFPNSMRWLTFKEAEREIEEHPAFRRAKEEAMAARKELVLYCDGGRRGDGSSYGSVRLNGRVLRREFGPGTSNEAEYKALVNALHMARRAVERGSQPDVVVIRMDSELVRNQVLGNWRCAAPHLRALRQRAVEEMDRLCAAMRRKPGDVAAVRLEKIGEREMKRVVGH